MSHDPNPEIVILGAGMAGLAAAYHIAVRNGIRNITIVDELEPLGLTSRRGTMAYRNWFPGPGDAMVQLTNRSIDLLREIDAESKHALKLSQNGYMYFSAKPAQAEGWREIGKDGEQRGVGPFREHSTGQTYISAPIPDGMTAPDGVDLVTSPEVIRALYPAITSDVTTLLHVRRAGAFDALYLGKWLLEQAQAHGAKFIQARVNSIETNGGAVESVHLASGETLYTRTLVVAAGPLLPQIAQMLDLAIPVYSELHAKITMPDTARVFPRYGDLMLWSDPQTLNWSEQERAELAAADATAPLTREIHPGVHFLPKGTAAEPTIMGLWTYDIHESPYQAPPKFEPHYADVVLRGLTRMIPAAQVYLNHQHSAIVDGGYYCKTRENRPLIGPLPVQGAYIIGALSGYGVMASQGAGDLLSSHVLGKSLPEYAKWFLLSRYNDPEYLALLKHWEPRSGQL